MDYETGLGKKQKESASSVKRKDWLYIWLAFACSYSWFNLFFYNGTHNPLSPLVPLVKDRGVNPEFYIGAIYIPLFVSVCICFFFIKEKMLYQNRRFWYVVHSLVFISVCLLPFTKSLLLFYLLLAVSGASCGIVFYRLFYSVFFFPPAIGWARMFVVILASLRFGVHLFSLVSPGEHPILMYIISVMILATAIFFSLKFKGNILESKAKMPESKPSIKLIAPYIVFMVAVQLLIAAQKAFIEPYLERQLSSMIVDIIATVATLSILWIFGDRVRKKETFLNLFFVFMMLAFASHQLLGMKGEPLTIVLLEPSFMFWDIFMYSIILSLFYNYGKRHAELRVVLLILLLGLLLGQTVFNSFFVRLAPMEGRYYGLIYVAAFFLYFLIPLVTKMANLTEIVGEKVAPFVSRGDEILETYSKYFYLGQESDNDFIKSILPENEKLTERESEILKCIIEEQDTEAISYSLSISQNTVRSHVKNICRKYGVNSKHELKETIVKKIVSQKRKENEKHENENLGKEIENERILLTQREKEVMKLLLAGASNEEMSEELHLSVATVRTHIYNISRKCDVNTRDELIRFINDKKSL